MYRENPSDRRSIIISILVPLLMTTTACERGSDRHQFDRYQEDGLTVIVNQGGPRYGTGLFRYEEVAFLHQDETRPESLVYPRALRRWDEQGFLMDAEGRFYVQDRGNHRIAVFGPDGRFERGIGRSGRGPGEFVFLHLYGLSDGVLQVYDESLHRFTYLRTDGGLVETVASPVGGVRVFLDRGRRTFTTREFPERQEEQELPQPEGITLAASGFHTYDRDGNSLGSAHSDMVPMYYAYHWAGHKGGVGSEDLPYTSYPAMAWAPDGIYLIDGQNPVIGHFTRDGAPVRRISLDLPDSEVTSPDRLRHIQDLEARMAEAAGDEFDVLAATRATLTFPEVKSHWRGIQVDDTGHIWLEVPEWDQALDGRGHGCLYQVLSPEGEYLGTTRTPAPGRVMRGHLLGVRVDPETGREDYVAWRLIPQAEGFVYP
jgi:hypothetical protein